MRTRLTTLLLALAALAVVAAGCGAGNDETAGDGGVLGTEEVQTGPTPESEQGESFDDPLAERTITLQFDDPNDMGVSGHATLTPVDENQTQLSVNLSSGDDIGLVALQRGDCNTLGNEAFTIEDVSGATAQTTMRISMIRLLEGNFAVTVYPAGGGQQPQGETQPIACANVPSKAEVDVTPQ